MPDLKIEVTNFEKGGPGNTYSAYSPYK